MLWTDIVYNGKELLPKKIPGPLTSRDRTEGDQGRYMPGVGPAAGDAAAVLPPGWNLWK